jgi:hypothetical protein
MLLYTIHGKSRYIIWVITGGRQRSCCKAVDSEALSFIIKEI